MKTANPNLGLESFDAPSRRFVALHHFHPSVVRAFYENPLTSAQKHKVPISITEHELKELNMDMNEQDRILSVTGVPTGGYYFVPSYPQGNAHEDLKTLIRAERASREASRAKVVLEKKVEEYSKPVPANIEISAVQSPVKPEKQDDDNDSSTEAIPDSNSNQEESDFNKPVKPEKQDDDNDSSTEAIPNSNSNQVDRDFNRPVKPKKQEDDDGSSTEAIPNSSSNQEDSDFNKLVSDSTTSEFDNIWGEGSTSKDNKQNELSEKSAAVTPFSDSKSQLDGAVAPTIMETDDEDNFEEEDEGVGLTSTAPSSEGIGRQSIARDADHPWDTPKYRRNSTRPDTVKRAPSAPAEFIDPSETVDLRSMTAEITTSSELSTAAETRGKEPAPSDEPPLSPAPRMWPGMEAISEDKPTSMRGIETFSPNLDGNEPDVLSKSDPPGHILPPIQKRSLSPIRRQKDTITETESVASDDSVGTAAVALTHQLPGTDPTLRIQVHNDLIAWESKRRSDLSNQLEFNRERWKAGRDILRDGVEELASAERLVLGFAKAGALFADALQAMYDDNLLDDAGNTVKNSFIQNRLQKQRSVQEYSIETTLSASSSEVGQSALLSSIIEAQLDHANVFKDSSHHMREEILPEIVELKADLKASSSQLETLGDSILGELKRSEIEVKNIWGTLIKLVCMQYSDMDISRFDSLQMFSMQL
jgi:hypothetical protein